LGEKVVIWQDVLFLQLMKLFLKHTIVVFLAILVVITSGGFSLFQHYCMCTGINSMSLYIPSDCCEHESTGHCSLNANDDHFPGCCTSSDDKETLGSPACETHEDCCSDKVFHYQIDSFDLSKSQKTILIGFIVIVANGLTNDHDIQLVLKRLSTGYSNDIPPPLYGRDLLSSIKQLKLDVPVV
jgi:hypothetical protein